MRRHHTPAERLAGARAWRASGLSAAEYCQRHGLSLSTLQRWVKEAGTAALSPPQFVRVEVERPRADLIVEARGARITVSRGFDADLLRDVVDALTGPRA